MVFFFVGGRGHYHYRIDHEHGKLEHWSPVLTPVKFISEKEKLNLVFSAFGNSFCCLYEADDPW